MKYAIVFISIFVLGCSVTEADIRDQSRKEFETDRQLFLDNLTKASEQYNHLTDEQLITAVRNSVLKLLESPGGAEFLVVAIEQTPVGRMVCGIVKDNNNTVDRFKSFYGVPGQIYIPSDVDHTKPESLFIVLGFRLCEASANSEG